MITNKQKEKQGVILSKAHDVYRKGLSAYASYKISNRSRSEDLVQETFFKTWKFIVKGGKIDIMKAFLYHVLNYLIIDEYRKHKTISLDVLLKKGFEPSIDDSEKIINEFDAKIAFSLIKRLPKKYQDIIRMRFIKDLSIDEISISKKQTKNTTAVQVHRGLERLKHLFEKYKK
jgi:RNA polymerase sigma-70 factor (ECF subfamily)